MNLSLYLLLAAENEPESKPPFGQKAAPAVACLAPPQRVVATQPVKPSTAVVYEPGLLAGKAMRQASYYRLSMAQTATNTMQSMSFCTTVLANAVGFLMLISGLLLLLAVAESGLV